MKTTKKDKYLGTKTVKVRMEKEYREAKNHIAVGEVLEENAQYLRMWCETYHFGKNRNKKDIITGGIKIRCFPWNRIAVITELPGDIEWEGAEFKLSEQGRLVLDDHRETSIDDEVD